MHCSALADLLGKRATLPGGRASHTPRRAPPSACPSYVSDSGWEDPTPFGICFIFFFLTPLGPYGAHVLVLPASVLHTGERAGGSQGQERAAQVDLRLCLKGTPHTPSPLTLNCSCAAAPDPRFAAQPLPEPPPSASSLCPLHRREPGRRAGHSHDGGSRLPGRSRQSRHSRPLTSP